MDLPDLERIFIEAINDRSGKYRASLTTSLAASDKAFRAFFECRIQTLSIPRRRSLSQRD
jgi:hypothetical protein